jgi:exonuclease SbcD
MLRFLQASDFHLDSAPGAGRLDLPPALREQLQRDVRAAVSAGLALARERDCQVVLLPGDLFDDETAGPDTAGYLKAQLDALAPIPVVITPGNHDYLSPASPYAADDWPANVHIFGTGDFTVLELWDLDLSITGCAQVHRGGISGWLGGLEVPRGECGTKLLVFHGARMLPNFRHDGRTMPFDEKMLLGLGFDYAAVGHYHDLAIFHDSGGVPRGAYAGCPQGRGLDETGPKGVIVGEIGDDASVALEHVRTCRRIIHSVTADATGAAYTEEIESRIAAALEADSPPPMPEDFVHIKVAGRPAPGVKPPPEEAFRSLYTHVKVEDLTRPGYNLDAYRRPEARATVAGRFVPAMDDLIEAAGDESERKMLASAVYYGLDALLEGEPIGPRYEDYES